ncbi:MAG TPA: DsbA family oxidoreductase, partial [Acidimicrobiales bacterium]|nr:DsbA family oxidoreductase [Acidimicrobiales bacterium]
LEIGQARAAMSRIVNAGAEVDIDFKFETMRPGNTFDAHRLVHLGKARGIQGAVKERLLQATFFEGEAIGTPEVLERLAVEAGLDAVDVRNVLTSDAFAEDVRVDERVAQSLGVTGVPFFLIDDAYGVPGAQDPSVYLNLLRRAWAETHRSIEVVAGGDACADGDACEI